MLLAFTAQRSTAQSILVVTMWREFSDCWYAMAQGQPPLWFAIFHGEYDMANLLLELGALPDESTKQLALQRRFSLDRHDRLLAYATSVAMNVKTLVSSPSQTLLLIRSKFPCCTDHFLATRPEMSPNIVLLG